MSLTSPLFWIALGILFYGIVLTLYQKPSHYPFLGYKIAQEMRLSEEERELHRSNALERGLFPFVKAVRKNLKLSDKQRSNLEKELAAAGSKDTPEEIVALSFIMGLATFLIIATFGWILQKNILYVVAIAGGLFMFRSPRKNLRDKAKKRRQKQEGELPDFLDNLLIYLSAGNTLYDALHKSTESVGPYLESDLRALLAEIEVTGEVIDSLQSFGRRIGTTEIYQFISALEQGYNSDERRAQEVYEKLSDQMRSLRQERVRTYIKKLPGEVSTYNMVLYLSIILIPLFGACYKLFSIF